MCPARDESGQIGWPVDIAQARKGNWPRPQPGGEPADRYPAFRQRNALYSWKKPDGPKAQQPLILRHGRRGGEPGDRVRRDTEQVAGREQNGFEPVQAGMLQCGAKTADGAQAGNGLVREHRQPVPAPSAQDKVVCLRRQSLRDMGDERLSLIPRKGLVAAEAARFATREDRSKDSPGGQAVSSNSSRPIR